ncbi:MAG: ThiF family adenylyltransferase, partial [Pseudomonadota bacterium]
MAPEEVERYARHLVLHEIGGPGQQRLRAATVAVVGAGGLGSPAILYLAAAGVGRIRVIDDDEVSLS